MSGETDTYRDWLVKADHGMSEAYDKAIMTLTGGALAISLAFVRDVTPHPSHKSWLATSWVLLAASLLAILISFLTSQTALRKAIKRFDENPSKPPRASWQAHITGLLNWLSCVTFVGGVGCLVRFALYNV